VLQLPTFENSVIFVMRYNETLISCQISVKRLKFVSSKFQMNFFLLKWLRFSHFSKLFFQLLLGCFKLKVRNTCNIPNWCHYSAVSSGRLCLALCITVGRLLVWLKNTFPSTQEVRRNFPMLVKLFIIFTAKTAVSIELVSTEYWLYFNSKSFFWWSTVREKLFKCFRLEG